MHRIMGIGRARRYEHKSYAKRSDMRILAPIAKMHQHEAIGFYS